IERQLLGGERLESMPEAFEFRVRNSRPCAARIAQLAGVVVVGQQQRPEAWARALWIGQTDHNEFLAVQAFRLYPQAPIAGRVGRVRALRDDAFNAEFARFGIEGWPTADVVIAVL